MKTFFISIFVLLCYGAIVVLILMQHQSENLYPSAIPYMEIWGNLGTGVAAISATVASVLLWKTYTFQTKELSSHTVLQLCKLYTNILEKTKIVGNQANISSTSAKGKQISHKPNLLKGREGLCQSISHVIDWAMSNDWDAPEGKDNTASVEVDSILTASVEVNSILTAAELRFNSYEVCFRLLHRIFKHIDDMKISDKEKQKYTRIPRSILSNAELEALLINCQTSRGEGMRKYIEKFHVLNNYSSDHSVVLQKSHAEELMKRYEKSAFEGNKAKSFGIINSF